jgi:hypothetical protein
VLAGTRIQIPPIPDEGSNPPVRTVSIAGSAQGCEQARSDIYNLVNGVRYLSGCVVVDFVCVLRGCCVSCRVSLTTCGVPGHASLCGRAVLVAEVASAAAVAATAAEAMVLAVRVVDTVVAEEATALVT